jgi:DNA polymerase elongation subunit (family B)
MRKYSEIRWSEIAKKAIESYINRLKVMDQLEKQKLLDHFDDVLKNSELSEEDITELDDKVKRGMHETLSKMVR